MKFEAFVRNVGRAAVIVSACGMVSACGGTNGFEPVHETGSVLGAIGNRLGHLVGFSDLAPASAPLPQSDALVECPSMDVQDGTASARFYRGSGQGNDDVRYAFTVGDVARECSKVGGQLQLKVGVAGRLLIGPAGESGTYSVPLRIVVRNDATQKALSSQLARVSATVPAGQSQADFTYVTEPFAVPFVPHPDDDYTILVGFDTTGKAADTAPAHHRRKPKR